MHCNETYLIDRPYGISLRKQATEMGFNIEHILPQSRFSTGKNDPERHYKMSDLHHIFASDKSVNRLRSNHRFGDVAHKSQVFPSLANLISIGADLNHFDPSGTYFETIRKWKGIAARALMYSSIRYEITLEPVELFYLKKWSKAAKVGDDEILRNDLVQELQYNRNPLVDHPELVDILTFQWD